MLDPQSPLPLYQQLKDVLRRSVTSGVWQPHDAIPPERELIARYGVSRITVRQALADLEAEGLLYRRHGKGTFVADRTHGPIAETLSELTGHLEELQLRGLQPDVEVLTLRLQPMPPAVAEVLQREPESAGWYLHRLVRVDQRPLMLTEAYLPADLGISPTQSLVRAAGMAQLLHEHGHVPARGMQRIGAETASVQVAALLALPPGEAVLRATRVIYGQGDRPLVWYRSLYRADRYEYEVQLKRRR